MPRFAFPIVSAGLAIVEQHHTTYAQALTLVKDDMKFLNDEDKRWMLSKTIERVWPFD